MLRKGAFLLIIILSLSLVSALDLSVEKEVVSDVVIAELDEPAVFDFTIKNNGERDSFEIYSLVSVELTPKTAFSLSRGESEELRVEVSPSETIRSNPGAFTFIYKIKGSNTGTMEDRLSINIVNLEDSLQITSDSINPESRRAAVHVENLQNFNFREIQAEFSSVFFSFQETFSLEPFEKKSFTVDLDDSDLGNLMAGPYLLDVKMNIKETEKNFESSIRFLEKSGIFTSESEEGFFIRRTEVEKRNEGNVPAVAEIIIEKNSFSNIFTTLSEPPSRREQDGFTTDYYWVKELRPGESLNVVVRTNWIILILIIIAVVVLIILFNIYLKSSLKLTKKITQVKTKGGEFALKVSVHARAKKYIEKINIVDKLPPIVKLYKRYGTIAPDRIDEKNRRLEWNIESLNEGEDRVVSYIIYSKIGVVGRFELPPAKAIYEKAARIKETQSNKVFFVSEPGKKLKEAD
jgi:hypothetical protein